MTTSLPTRIRLLGACRGDACESDPLLRAARALTELHACRLREVGEPDIVRSDLVRDVDRYVGTLFMSAPGGAYLHTETVGAVVDRLARYTATAHHALSTGSGWTLWHTWERLAELSLAYEDLVTELTAGRRRLPTPS